MTSTNPKYWKSVYTNKKTKVMQTDEAIRKELDSWVLKGYSIYTCTSPEDTKAFIKSLGTQNTQFRYITQENYIRLGGFLNKIEDTHIRVHGFGSCVWSVQYENIKYVGHKKWVKKEAPTIYTKEDAEVCKFKNFVNDL
jgi:hypothetical protein